MAVVANDRAALSRRRATTTTAVIANLAVAVVHVTAAASTPATFDPNVAASAILPATLLPDVADALALVVAVAPLPLTTAPDPTAFDPDVSGARVHHDDARRGRLFLDLDDGHWNAHVTVSTYDASGAQGRKCAGDG